MMTMIISGSDGVTFPDSTNQFSGGAFSFKNRILNGDMRIDQRNAGASLTVNDNAPFYPVDRWQAFGQSGDGVYTIQQSTTAPTGFNNSVIATVTTADASIGSTQTYLIRQRIEGFNFADLGFGTASAKTVTASFWVRSSLTGTFGGALVNGGSDRSNPFTYTISVADTWEYKTVTITGDTTGTWSSDNSTGAMLTFSLGTGTSRLGTPGTWAAVNYQGATGQTNLIATNGATWYITGVQLEVGSVATPFERRPYGTEFMLCQRYYQTINAVTAIGNFFDNTQAIGAVFYPVAMRASPTVSASGALNLTDTGANYTQSSAVFTSSTLDQYSAAVRFNNLTGTTAYRPYFYNYSNSSNRFLQFSAEL